MRCPSAGSSPIRARLHEPCAAKVGVRRHRSNILDKYAALARAGTLKPEHVATMAQDTDYYREADLKKFTRIGVVVVVVVALIGWFFYNRASNEIRADNREAVFGRPASQPAAGPQTNSDSVENRIQNWNRNQSAQPAR